MAAVQVNSPIYGLSKRDSAYSWEFLSLSSSSVFHFSICTSELAMAANMVFWALLVAETSMNHDKKFSYISEHYIHFF